MADYATPFLTRQAIMVMLLQGETPTGAPTYAYVAVRADRLEAFMKAQNEPYFIPEDYGVILESGEGEPPAEIREKMEREYGFNHDAMIDIPAPQPDDVYPDDTIINEEE